MTDTVKISNVLGDSTRYHIYQYMIKHHTDVSVNETAAHFSIHPNVARMHLAKLEDVNLITSYTQKNGKGGRPKRCYRLSDDVIELSFPHRDYKLLSSIAIESFLGLGELGQQALYDTGKKYGMKVMERYQQTGQFPEQCTMEQKLHMLHDAGTMLGMFPDFTYDDDKHCILLRINNCPFKEIAADNHAMVCHMHYSFLKGMFEALFTGIELVETENMFTGCENCSYVAKLTNV